MSNFIVQALRGAPITLFGDGAQTRSFCFVDDMIEGCVRLMATSPEITGPINLGNPVETSMLQLAQTIVRLTGSKSSTVHQPLPPDDPRQPQPDIDQAQAVLEWKPTVELEAGLKRTIAYFDELLRAQ